MEVREECVPVNVEDDGTIAACICTTDFCNGIDHQLAAAKSEVKPSDETVIDEIDFTISTTTTAAATAVTEIIQVPTEASPEFSQIICHQCGSLFSNKNSDCDVFDENDPSQEGFCAPGEACLWYSWQKTKVNNEGHSLNILRASTFHLATSHYYPIKCLVSPYFTDVCFRTRQLLFVNVFPRQYCWEHWSIRSDPAPHVNLRISLSQDRQWWLVCVTQIIVIHIAVQLNPRLTPPRHPDNPH